MKNQQRVQKLSLNIKAVAFDNDGVLTDNTEIIGLKSGEVLKRRSHYDGQGISFLRAIGIRVAILTGDSGNGAEAITQLVIKWNKLPSVQSDEWDKVHLVTGIMGQAKAEALQKWISAHQSISLSQCAVMGDDYVDWKMMQIAGLRASPITAEKRIREISHFVSERPAGAGAVRDFVNFILESRGINPADLATS